MNTKYNTDLQVAQDLQKLSDTINGAVDYANRTLEEAKKVPELQQMIAEAHLARTSIENASSTLIYIKASIDSKVKEAQEIECQVTEIKSLISKLSSIKGENERSEILLEKISLAYSSLNELSNDLFYISALGKYLQKCTRYYNTKQLFLLLCKDFGVAGIFIYLLICKIPKNKLINSSPRKF